MNWELTPAYWAVILAFHSSFHSVSKSLQILSFFSSMSSIDSFSWRSHTTSVLAFMVLRPFSFPCWISSCSPQCCSRGWCHSCAQVTSNLGSCADHTVCLESHSSWCQILLIVYPLLKKKIYIPPSLIWFDNGL